MHRELVMGYCTMVRVTTTLGKPTMSCMTLLGLAASHPKKEAQGAAARRFKRGEERQA